MTPHFMFNALNSVQLLVSKGQQASAVRHVAKFANLMRKVLHSSDHDFVSLDEELDALELYLELERLRFPDKFSFKIDTRNLDRTKQQLIPPMIIQPFVENAIWHGVMKKHPQEGHVEINLTSVEGRLECTITDDGIGREQASRMEDVRVGQGVSSGMRMVRNRIENIRLQFGLEIRLEIEDLKDADGNALGTRVHIAFPEKTDVEHVKGGA